MKAALSPLPGRILYILFSVFIFFASLNLTAQSLTVPVRFGREDFRVEQGDGHSTITPLKTGEAVYFQREGDPKLPYLPVYIVLYHNSSVDTILPGGTRFEHIEGRFDFHTVSGETKSFPEGNRMIRYDPPQLYAGFLVLKVYICPFRYVPASHQVFFNPEITLDVRYRTAGKPQKMESSQEKIGQSRKYARELVINGELLDNMIPLEEKFDYSRVHLYREERDSVVNAQESTSQDESRQKKDKPFYIRHIKTK